MQIKIDKKRCKGCGLCVITCHKKLITMSKKRNNSGFALPEIINIKKCNQCAMCCQICPDVAIEIK